MKDFALEEWEWPPCAERRYLVEPFQSECLAAFGFTRITVCAVPHGIAGTGPREIAILFFRPEAWRDTLDLSWFKLNSGVPIPNYTVAWNGALDGCSSPPTRETIEVAIKKRFQPDSWGVRYFNLGVDQCYLFPQDARWYDEEDPTNLWEPPTYFRLPPGLSGQSSADILGWLQEQLTENDSELGFAAHWNQMTRMQRDEAILELAPQLTQWRRVTQAIADVEAYLLSGPLYWQLALTHPMDEGTNKKSELPCTSRGIRITDPAFNARLSLWKQLLLRHFPFPLLEENSMPLCQWNAYRQRTGFLSAINRDISAHEHLETGLFLREWAQDKATPVELEILFPTS